MSTRPARKKGAVATNWPTDEEMAAMVEEAYALNPPPPLDSSEILLLREHWAWYVQEIKPRSSRPNQR